MKFRASGDVSGLVALAQRLESMSDHMDVVATALADEVVNSLIPGQLEREEDPSGTKWRPIKRHGEILRDKGALFSGWNRGAVVEKNRQGFTVENPVPYAAVHQFGSGTYAGGSAYAIPNAFGSGKTVLHPGVPARPMVPDSGELPPSWDTSLRETAEETLAALLGGKL